jgi:hypothetical protein
MIFWQQEQEIFNVSSYFSMDSVLTEDDAQICLIFSDFVQAINSAVSIFLNGREDGSYYEFLDSLAPAVIGDLMWVFGQLCEFCEVTSPEFHSVKGFQEWALEFMREEFSAVHSNILCEPTSVLHESSHACLLTEEPILIGVSSLVKNILDEHVQSLPLISEAAMSTGITPAEILRDQFWGGMASNVFSEREQILGFSLDGFPEVRQCISWETRKQRDFYGSYWSAVSRVRQIW